MERPFILGALIVPIMWATPAFVNAERTIFTETIPSRKAAGATTRRIDAFVALIDSKGKAEVLDKAIGLAFGTGENTPTKYIELRPSHPQWERKICAVAYSAKGSPQCILLMEKKKAGKIVTISHYQYDLSGRILGAYIMTGKLDDTDKPIRGSAEQQRLDISDFSVKKTAERELKFWLSGKYKGYLAEDAAKAGAPAKTAP